MRQFTLKLFFIVVLLYTSVVSVFSSDYFSFLTNNTYAFYHDQRGDMNFYRGYWYSAVEGGKHFFAISNIDLDTDQQINFMVTLDLNDAGEPELVDIQGVLNDMQPEFTQCWVDIMNFLYFRKDAKKQITADCYLDDPWPNYTQVYHYSTSAPFFGFLDIAIKGHDPAYSLDQAGILDFEDIHNFFAMRPLDRSSVSEKRYQQLQIPYRAKRSVSLGPRTLTVDDRWSLDTSLGFPSYWFEHENYRDSQIMLESQEWRNLQNMGFDTVEDLASVTLPMMGNLLYNTYRSWLDDGKLVVEVYLIDNNGFRNYQRLYEWIDGGVFYTLNFSTFASIYEANRAYYNAIITSVLQD